MEPSQEEKGGSEISNFEFITDGVLLSIVCAFGIIGNMFTLFVLSRPQMKSSVNCYLLYLAVYDMLFLVCKTFLHVIYVFSAEDETMHQVYAALYPIPLYLIGVLTYIVRMGSIWTTVGVSVERYIAVCHPLKAIIFCTYKRTVLANLLIGFLVICFNIPQFFVNEVTSVTDDFSNETVTILRPTAFGESYFYLDVYETWMNCVANSVVPFLSMLCLNVAIYRAIRKAHSFRQEITQEQKTNIRLAFLLFCIVVIFFISYTPSFFFGIASSAGFSEQFSERLPTLLHLTEALNSSANFIVYCVVGRNFRKMMLHLFCRKKTIDNSAPREKYFPAGEQPAT